MFDFIISLIKVTLFITGGYLILRMVAKKYAPEQLATFETKAKHTVHSAASKVKALTVDTAVGTRVTTASGNACGHVQAAGTRALDTTPRDIGVHVAKAGRGACGAMRTFVSTWRATKDTAAK